MNQERLKYLADKAGIDRNLVASLELLEQKSTLKDSAYSRYKKRNGIANQYNYYKLKMEYGLEFVLKIQAAKDRKFDTMERRNE